MARKALILAAGILLAGGVAVTCACQCVPTTSPKEALVKADAVFAGTVESIEEPVLHLRGMNLILSMRKVTFRVSETWKGANAAKLVVYTDSTWAGCYAPFDGGSNYVVYAHLNQGVGALATSLFTSMCTRTCEYSKAAEDLRELGPGQKPKTK